MHIVHMHVSVLSSYQRSHDFWFTYTECNTYSNIYVALITGLQGLDGRDGLPGEPGLDGVPGKAKLLF